MNKKRNFQGDQQNQQKNIRKRNKIDQEQNKVKYPENDPHVRDMDDGNGEILGGKI